MAALRYGPWLAALSLFAFAMHLRADNASLQATADAQAREIMTLNVQVSQAREAAEVARATADREASDARKYNALREALIKGDEDVDLPDFFVELLADLGLGGVR